MIVDASVLIATRNRPDLLARTLGHIARQAAPGLRFEVIVADNGDDTATAAVLAAAAATMPVVAVSEPCAGKNRALNRALPRARGALLVFTDDDVEPEARWLGEYVAAARRWPGHGIFGGPITARLPAGAPSWLETHVPPAAFARFDPGLPEGPCATLPYGPNFALRAACMAGRAFREDFGSRGGTHDLMGGETELLERLTRAGERAVFVPTARVVHHVEPAATTPEWLRRRAFRHGRTYRRLAAVAGAVNGGTTRLCGRLVVRWLAHAIAVPRGEAARVGAAIRLFHARGQLYEHVLTRTATRRLAGVLLP